MVYVQTNAHHTHPAGFRAQAAVADGVAAGDYVCSGPDVREPAQHSLCACMCVRTKPVVRNDRESTAARTGERLYGYATRTEYIGPMNWLTLRPVETSTPARRQMSIPTPKAATCFEGRQRFGF